jgi:hypothetical protein
MRATLDGRVEASGAVFEAKFMLPWAFSEEAAAEKYMPQLQHNMWVVAARSAVLSVITGGGKWVEITTHADPLYQHLIVTAERKFWRCVETGERPRLFGGEPPKPRIEAVRIVDMSASNSWAEFAGLFRSTRSAFLEHERSKAELKSALFTLVGIAGEDDLDAPDLLAPTPAPCPSKQPKRDSRSTGNGGGNHDARLKPAAQKTKLSLALSASLRDELLREIDSLNVDDEATLWARRRGGAKNSLNAADAELVEQAFRRRLATIAHKPANESATEASPRGDRNRYRKKQRRTALVEKSVLAVPTPRRIRDRDHVKSVAQQPCLAVQPKTAQRPNVRRGTPQS